MNDRQLTELVRRYQSHLAHTGSTLAASAVKAWDELDSWDEVDLAELTAMLEPAAAAATTHATNLAVGFIALAKGLGVTPIESPAPVDWSNGFFAYWKSLTSSPWDQAIQVGRNTIASVGFDAVQSAARSASSQIDRREPAITRWARVPDGSACSWCLEVAGDNYLSAESADFGHERCGCAVVPA